MSISVIIVSPRNAQEKAYNLPVLTEDVFRQALLPAAERAGAQIVPLFGVGFELSQADWPPLRSELQRIGDSLDASREPGAHVRARLQRLAADLERIFGDRPDALLYIG